MLKRSITRIPLLVCALSILMVLMGASSALAMSPWWHLTSGSRPTVLPSEAGGRGEVIVVATNRGDASASGETTPVQITDALPAGLAVTSVTGIAGQNGSLGDPGKNRGPVTCVKAPTLTCTFKGRLPPFDTIELRIAVEVKSALESGEVNQATVSGGGATPVSVSRPLGMGEGATPFGLEEYELGFEEEGGATVTQAGSHPFQQTVELSVNQAPPTLGHYGYQANSAALPKDVKVGLPPGLIGNPSPFPRCPLAKFLVEIEVLGAKNECLPEDVVGVAVTTFDEPANLGTNTLTVPVFNLEPSFGEPARFGFLLPISPVLIDASLRSGPGEDYGITAYTPNITESAELLSSQVTLWGVPGDPRHNSARGFGCIEEEREAKHLAQPCTPSEESHPPALLTLPTSCTGPLQSSVEGDSWLSPGAFLAPLPSTPVPGLLGCNRLPFDPSVSAEPSTDRASAPSGLDFNLDFHDEGLTNPEGLAESQMKDTFVTLPEGLTINPSAGVGLGGCSPAEYARETLDSLAGEGCPNDSKLGTVEVTTPLLSTAIHGSLFIAQPYDNPFSEPGHPNGSLVALYVVLKNPETGALIKLPGKVTPNPVTGQLTTMFDNNPQLPFDHFNFHFREGQQAPLISPPTCGTYTTKAALTPWSEPSSTLTEASSFTITKGYDGGACPAGGAPPFNPQIEAGLLNNNGGAFSPFYLHLARSDGDQEISSFSTDLPAGLTGDLSGIPFCPEADIALARAKTGAQEEAEPSCPAASEIGHTLVGTGVGAVLAYVPGKIYLAGPYDGDPFSLVSVTSAVVGPFDLGTVVIRFGLKIDPDTAQVSVDPSASEPIPHIIDGVVTHVRDIRVYIDRQRFTLNPTSCNPMQISSTLGSDLGEHTTISSRFQATNCQALAFKPQFKVSTSGKTSRSQGASLSVKLAYSKAPQGTQANIRMVKVDLPKQLPSRLSTLQNACPDSTFDANPAACPAASRVGRASAITPILPVPLTGPAYFVSHSDLKFPELIIVLQGYGVTVDLFGETFISKAGVTSSTFRTIPDEPVSTFELTLPEGPNSALAAPHSLCAAKLAMPTAFTAQNGVTIKQTTPIAVTNCPKHKTKKKAKKASKRHKGTTHGKR